MQAFVSILMEPIKRTLSPPPQPPPPVIINTIFKRVNHEFDLSSDIGVFPSLESHYRFACEQYVVQCRVVPTGWKYSTDDGSGKQKPRVCESAAR